MSRNEAVAVATGGTVITDTLVLFVLAAIAGTATGGSGIRSLRNVTYLVYSVPFIHGLCRPARLTVGLQAS
ncbi:MAG: hypothetical protein MZV63_21815 [Marinilabiliales bacterium]|nr:hypothetical protein [Marinilabiliales bacterium]